MIIQNRNNGHVESRMIISLSSVICLLYVLLLLIFSINKEQAINPHLKRRLIY